VVVLVDNYAIHPADRNQVVAGLRDYLERGLDGDAWFAIASYDGYLRMHQTFTRDRARLLEALADLGEMSPLGSLMMAERSSIFRNGLNELRTIESLVGDPARGDSAEISRRLAAFSRQVATHAEELRRQNLTAFHAIGHLVNALAPLPGRKALVYVSEGLPMRPGEELLAAAQNTHQDVGPGGLDVNTADGRNADIDLRSGSLDVLSQSVPTTGRSRGRSKDSGRQRPDGLLELTAMANAYQVSLYTLKPVTEYGGIPAEFGGDVAHLFSPQTQRVREQNLAETLEVMAADTGGLSYFGGGIANLIDRARSELTDHYSLAYTPDHHGDGRYHEIKVKVSGKKLRVRHRGGYVDKSIEAKLADRTTAALLLALDDNPHGILLGTAAPEPGPEDAQWIVPVEVEIPLEALTLVDRGDSLISDARLFVASRGTDGRTAPVQAMELHIEVPKSVQDPRDQSYTARFNLMLRSGDQRLAIGLLDPAAETISLVSHEVLIGSTSG